MKREQLELERVPQAELKELAGIYEKRGLDKGLVVQVAKQLTAHDQLGAHLRDELGAELSKPFQAAWISALSFACFALVPILAYLVAPRSPLGIWAIAFASLASLTALGSLGGHLGVLRASGPRCASPSAAAWRWP